MTPYDLIVMYRKTLELPSDNAAGKRLGLTRGAISAVKQGGSMGNETAWKIAEVIDMDPAEVIAICELARAERSEDPDRVEMWKARFRAVSHSAATIFGLIALPYGIWLTDRLCILCSIEDRPGLKRQVA